MFSEMGEIDNVINRMFEQARNNSVQSEPFYYSVQITRSPEGTLVIQESSNINPRKLRQRKFKSSEPIVDVSVDEKTDTLKIVAEMPGASKENIKLNANENQVTISSNNVNKPYNITVPLPREIDQDTADTSYNNGVLEVVFHLKARNLSKGVNIRID
jgi:HSP20 family protein